LNNILTDYLDAHYIIYTDGRARGFSNRGAEQGERIQRV